MTRFIPPARVAGMIAGGALAFLLFQAAAFGWSTYRAAQVLERADVFEYYAINFVRHDGDALLMESDAEWFIAVDGVTWVDRLVCDGRVRSSLANIAPGREASERNVAQWDYTADVPEPGRFSACTIESEIIAEVGGRAYVQRIESEVFTP